MKMLSFGHLNARNQKILFFIIKRTNFKLTIFVIEMKYPYMYYPNFIRILVNFDEVIVILHPVALYNFKKIII